MKEYEIVAKYFNACAGSSRPQTFFEEAELDSTDAFVRTKHYADFDKFDRIRYPKVIYAGMLEYDGDLHIPNKYLVSPPEITNTMSEYMANTGINVLAISETQGMIEEKTIKK